MHLIFLGAFLYCYFSMPAQNCTIVRGIAHQRTTIPGNYPRKQLDEAGKEVQTPPKFMNTYFVFIETPKACTLEIKRMWIDNTPYDVAMEEAQTLPVVLQSSNPSAKADTLVKATTNKVIRLQLTGQLQDKSTKRPPTKYKKDRIVIEYKNRGRERWFGIGEIKRIAPVVLQ